MGFVVRGIEHIPPAAQSGAVTIGNFDGVHRGHRALLSRLKRVAQELGGPAVVLTFDPPPARLLRPDQAPPALTWMERRSEILFNLGVDFICICQTTHALLELTPESFFQQVLLDHLRMVGMVEGPNFRFGKDRHGDVELLTELCQRHQVRLSVAAAEAEDGEWISSSRIRSLISEGDLRAANRLLLEPYRIRGLVQPGAARGRQLGFPTANLEQIPVLLPPHGVYAGLASVQGERYAAAIHLGPNPTFGEAAPKVEVHLLEFAGDLYGQWIEVELWEQLRGIRKFSGVEQLLAQLRADIDRTRTMVLQPSLLPKP